MISKTIKYLELHGVKPSVQRIAVMDYLLKNKTHPTTDEIYSALSSSMPTLSRTTVYNTLKLLVEKGAALGLDIDEKQTHYDGDTTLHAHFRCKSCSVIIDLPMETIERVDPELLKGFVVSEINLYYKGYCDKCSNQGCLNTIDQLIN